VYRDGIIYQEFDPHSGKTAEDGRVCRSRALRGQEEFRAEGGLVEFMVAFPSLTANLGEM